MNLSSIPFAFALLSRYFEESHLPKRLPDLLPDDWLGGFMLLVLVSVLSGFLDNIAAALIGGTVAASGALLVCGIPASIQQQRFAPIAKSDTEHAIVDRPRVSIAGIILASAVLDNIPLTKLALEQGGYDWGVLAYVAGFGALMLLLGWHPN